MLDRRVERRAEVISAGTLESPSGTFLAGLGAVPVSSGVSVTPRSAEGIPVVFACDKVIKQDIGKTPIKLKRRNKDGSRIDDVNHPVYHALHDLANPCMTAFEFKETMQGWLNLWGNAYAEIVRTRDEVQLWPLDSSRMTVDLDSFNRLRYTYKQGTSRAREWIFDPANPPIFHLRENSLDGIHGRSPIQVLREAMGAQIAADRYVGRFYGQGGHPRVALSTSQKLTGDAVKRIRSDFETMTVGEQNWHRVVVMDHDLKPVPMVMPNRDAQFVELQKLGRSALCGAFRVPAHKVNDLERATFSNIEHQSIEWVTDGLMPHFVCWQQAIGRDLLNPKTFATHFAVFDVRELVRGDFKTFNDGLAVMRQNGAITANQWRAELDMDDHIAPEDGGDLYLVNGNMLPLRRDPAAVLDAPMGIDQGTVN